MLYILATFMLHSANSVVVYGRINSDYHAITFPLSSANNTIVDYYINVFLTGLFLGQSYNMSSQK